MSDSFISREWREETLRWFCFISQLPADEDREITFLCHYFISYVTDLTGWYLMRWELRWQCPRGSRVPPQRQVQTHALMYSSLVKWYSSRHFKASSLLTFSSPICKESHPAAIIIILETPKIHQLNDLFDDYVSLCTLSIHPACVTCRLYGSHKEQVGIRSLISCDNWFTYCDKTLATVTTDCRHWALHFYS